MGLEAESTNREKFQPAGSNTKRERNTDPADSVKKVVSGVERFRFFCGLAQRRGSLFFLCPRHFRRSAFPALRSVSFGKYRDKGECAEGLFADISIMIVISLVIFRYNANPKNKRVILPL